MYPYQAQQPLFGSNYPVNQPAPPAQVPAPAQKVQPRVAARTQDQPPPSPVPAVGVPQLPTPGVSMAPAAPQSDAYAKLLEDNLMAAQANLATMQRPEQPTIINTIRGNRVGREIPVMEANAIADWQRAQSTVASNSNALESYRQGLLNQSAQREGIQAEAEFNRARAEQSRSQASVFGDPQKMMAYLVSQGVPIDQAQQATSGLSGLAPGQKPAEVTGQNLPRMLRQTENEYLGQFFDPANPGYNKGMSAPDLFHYLMKASPKEALDPSSTLAKTIMAGMQQRFPDGFGGYATSSPDDFQPFGLPKGFFPTSFFNQYIGGPVLSAMTAGRAPTWDWRQSHERGKFFDDYIKRFNQAQQPQAIGVPGVPMPGILTGGG